MLGRAAMGETLASGALSDQWRIHRAGRLVHAEALRIDGDIARATAGPATLGGARALATLVHVAPGGRSPARRRPRPARRARRASPPPPPPRGGVLILRFLAPDNAPLRAALIRFLVAFRAAPAAARLVPLKGRR